MQNRRYLQILFKPGYSVLNFLYDVEQNCYLLKKGLFPKFYNMDKKKIRYVVSTIIWILLDRLEPALVEET